MNQEDYQLYNKLCTLRNNLQEYFYTSGRKPIICTEDALKLLVKYKPTTLSDMAGISGIGSNFIDNYGKFFCKKF